MYKAISKETGKEIQGTLISQLGKYYIVPSHANLENRDLTIEAIEVIPKTIKEVKQRG